MIRRARLPAVAALTALLATPLPATATAAAAPAVTPSPISLIAQRTGRLGDSPDYAKNLVRVDGGATRITLRPGTVNGVPAMSFVAATYPAGSTTEDSDQHLEETFTAGLKPGRYTASRIPGQAQALADDAGDCYGTDVPILTVYQASYTDAQHPTVFAADLDSSCNGRPYHSAVRWHSTVGAPVTTAVATATTPDTVTVNSTADTTVVYTAVGNAPALLGRLSLHEEPFEGRTSWTLLSDDCSLKRLAPGDSCRVVTRFAPVVPNGFPAGSDDAWLSLADAFGRPGLDTVTALHGMVRPLDDQPMYVYARGGYRHVRVTWAPPYQRTRGGAITYRVDRVNPDGTRTEVAETNGLDTMVTGVPDNQTQAFQVTMLVDGEPGPPSATTTATTAGRELVFTGSALGINDQQLLPTPTPAEGYRGVEQYATSTSGLLSVSRNQTTMAWDIRDVGNKVAGIQYAPTDGGAAATTVPGNAWDTDPALSPDATRLVFTHAGAPDDPATELRLVDVTAPTNAPTAIAGSAGLSDPTFTADGQSIVAVRGGELVELPVSGGSPTVIPGSTGGSAPDVGPDGRIAMVIATDAAWPAATSVVVLDPATGDRTALAGAADSPADRSANRHPLWSPDGRTIWFSRASVLDYDHTQTAFADGWALSLADGSVRNLTQSTGHSEDTAVVLQADTGASDQWPSATGAQPPADRTAPTVALTGPTSSLILDAATTATWTATDPTTAGTPSSGLANYDARYRVESPSAAFGAYVYPSSWQGITSPGVVLTLARGSHYCLSVRARDHAGNASGWSAERCTSTPLDDRSFSTKASSRNSSKYYLGTYAKATKAAITFTRKNMTLSRIGVVATTCSSCGSLEVLINGHKVGTLKLKASTTTYRHIVWLAAFKRTTGTVQFRTTSTQQVLFDGVVTQR